MSTRLSDDCLYSSKYQISLHLQSFSPGLSFRFGQKYKNRSIPDLSYEIVDLNTHSKQEMQIKIEFCHKDVLGDDLFLEILNWATYLIYNNIQGLFFVVFFIYMSTELGAALYFALFVPNFNSLQYSLTTVGLLFIFLNYVTLLTLKKPYHKVLDEVMPILHPLKSAGPKSYEKLKKIARSMKITLMVITVIYVMSIFILMPWYGVDYNFHFSIMFWTKYYPSLSKVAVALHFGQFYHCGLVIMSNVSFMTYLVIHIRSQAFLLNVNIRSINIDNIQEMGINQEIIRAKLVSCIQHHQIILHFVHRVNLLLYNPMIYFTCTSVLTITSLLFYIFHNPTWVTLLRLCGIGLGGFLILTVFAAIGQSMEDELNNIYRSLINLKWYSFNNQNRKLLSLFILLSQRPMKLSSSGLIDINFGLLIRVFQSVQTILTFLINFK